LRLKMGMPQLAARELRQAGRPPDARTRRRDVGLCLELARAHRTAGEPEAAVDWYLRAADLEPACVEAFRSLTELHRERGELRRARLTAMELVQAAPDDPAALELATDISRELGDWDRTVALIGRWLSLIERLPAGARPGEKSVIAMRRAKARAHLMMGEMTEARDGYRLLLEIAPACQEAAWELAKLAAVSGDSRAQRAYLKRLLLVNAAHDGALDMMAALEEVAGRHKEERAHLEKLLLLRPGNLDVVRRLARAAHRCGALRTARELLDRVIQLRPRDLSSLQELGSVMLKMGERAAAAGLFETVIGSAPGSPEAQLARWELNAMRGRDEGGVVLKVRRR
jgi:tetratricopeptide (TPR) repeat protein